jgi:hypothetical protein
MRRPTFLRETSAAVAFSGMTVPSTAGFRRSLRLSLLSIATVFGAVAAISGTASIDPAALKAIPAREKKPHTQTVFATPPLTAAERAALKSKLDVIRATLLATPAIRNLQGFDWATWARVTGDHPGRPIKTTLGFIAYPYTINPTTHLPESSAEGAPFTIAINDPDVVLGNGTYRVDEDARFTFAPEPAGTIDGLPVYSTSDRFIVISKDNRPLFVPVTQQQLLELRIVQRRRSLADLKTALANLPDTPAKAASLDAEQKRLTSLESELVRLSAADRMQPALDPDGARTTRASGLAEPGAPRTRAIVTVNPGLMDATRPRTDVQLIVIGSIRYEPALFGEVQRELDKEALLKLLD